MCTVCFVESQQHQIVLLSSHWSRSTVVFILTQIVLLFSYWSRTYCCLHADPDRTVVFTLIQIVLLSSHWSRSYFTFPLATLPLFIAMTTSPLSYTAPVYRHDLTSPLNYISLVYRYDFSLYCRTSSHPYRPLRTFSYTSPRILVIFLISLYIYYSCIVVILATSSRVMTLLTLVTFCCIFPFIVGLFPLNALTPP